VGACAQVVQNKEDMLAAAGFTIVPANTPQRQAALAAMPPHKFVHQTRNGAMLYAYADPTICDCLYVGNQDAYGRYQREVFLKDLANEQRMTDDMYQMSWDTWGPGWYY
jgi:hypothetical protein